MPGGIPTAPPAKEAVPYEAESQLIVVALTGAVGQEVGFEEDLKSQQVLL